MKYFKELQKICGLVLCVILLFCSVSFGSVEAKLVDNSYKIDDALKEQLIYADDNDFIPISVWIKDIDHNEEYQLTKNVLCEKFSTQENYPEILGLLNIASASNSLTSEFDYSRIDRAVSIDEMQSLISTKRSISSSLYYQSNLSIVCNIFTQKETEENVVFISHYTPNFIANVNKEDIYNLADNENVDYIFYIDDSIKDSDIICDDAPDEPYPSDLTYYQYEMTGIDTMRELGFTGEDINVGIYDLYFSKVDSIDYIDINKLTQHTGDTTVTWYPYFAKHGNRVASIIAGEYHDDDVDFYGAVPDAELFLADKVDGSSSSSGLYAIRKAEYERLLDNNVNVINVCRGLKGYLNTYTDLTMFIDHIVSQHNVHVVVAAGNNGSDGIFNSAYGYNSITVGACNGEGELEDYSSYATPDELNPNGDDNNRISHLYKPDVVAPGRMAIPSFRVDPNGPVYMQWGTSFAAPIVTGGVAQLCQASASLAINPRIMKAVVLAGSTINTYMSESDMITTNTLLADNKLSREYGAGVFNAYRSYQSFVLQQNGLIGYFVPNTTNVQTCSKSITVNQGDIIRASYVWDKKTEMSGDHTISNVNACGFDPYLLEVKTPSNVSYRAYCDFDTKDLVSFRATESGLYQISFVKLAMPGSSTNWITSYGFLLSVQSDPYFNNE